MFRLTSASMIAAAALLLFERPAAKAQWPPYSQLMSFRRNGFLRGMFAARGNAHGSTATRI
jgi:hypothetical protein